MDVLRAAAQLLCEEISTDTEWPALDAITGHEIVANAIFERWSAFSASAGKPVVLQRPALSWRVSYATKDTVSPLAVT